MSRVLIVDRETDHREHLAAMVAEHGCVVELAADLAAARAVLRESRPQLVIAASRLGDESGIELLRDLEETPEVEVVLTAARPEIDGAIAAVRLGALDYLPTPIEPDDLDRVVKAAIGLVSTPSHQSVDERVDPDQAARLDEMITGSPLMRRVFHRIRRVAPTDVTVMIIGDSGTGKELVARAIHRLSSRRDGPCLAVNCGAISPTVIESELFGHERGSFTGASRRHIGYFERAAGGTLLLDEITEMSEDLQVKLLRVIETGKVLRVGGTSPITASPRILATTNRDPETSVRTGRLRDDLYYRLKAFQIRVPSLVDRGPREVELFALHFLEKLNARHGSDRLISERALETLSRYHWPGNVRELRNTVEAAYVLAADEIDTGSLPPEIVHGRRSPAPDHRRQIRVPVGSTIATAERQLIMATLDECDGDKRAAAATLGISVKTLYNRLKKYRESQG
jgi:DNA-binding NtrC family response regulator